MSPRELAAELGISPKTLRQGLRDKYPTKAPGKGGRWSLTEQMVGWARGRWA